MYNVHVGTSLFSSFFLCLEDDDTKKNVYKLFVKNRSAWLGSVKKL